MASPIKHPCKVGVAVIGADGNPLSIFAGIIRLRGFIICAPCDISDQQVVGK